MTTTTANKITFKQLSPTSARVMVNGKATPYIVSKGGNFYEIHWKGHPLPAYYCSDNKAKIIETIKEIATLPCKPRPYSNLYYVPYN